MSTKSRSQSIRDWGTFTCAAVTALTTVFGLVPAALKTGNEVTNLAATTHNLKAQTDLARGELETRKAHFGSDLAQRAGERDTGGLTSGTSERGGSWRDYPNTGIGNSRSKSVRTHAHR